MKVRRGRHSKRSTAHASHARVVCQDAVSCRDCGTKARVMLIGFGSLVSHAKNMMVLRPCGWAVTSRRPSALPSTRAWQAKRRRRLRDTITYMISSSTTCTSTKRVSSVFRAGAPAQRRPGCRTTPPRRTLGESCLGGIWWQASEGDENNENTAKRPRRKRFNEKAGPRDHQKCRHLTS